MWAGGQDGTERGRGEAEEGTIQHTNSIALPMPSHDMLRVDTGLSVLCNVRLDTAARVVVVVVVVVVSSGGVVVPGTAGASRHGTALSRI